LGWSIGPLKKAWSMLFFHYRAYRDKHWAERQLIQTVTGIETFRQDFIYFDAVL
jgi:hypothetical protein